MIIADLMHELEGLMPISLAESWDNNGLLLGTMHHNIHEIVIALEADAKTIDATPPNAALIVHHPLLFSAIKSLRTDQYPGIYLERCWKKNIQLIAMHTNADAAFLGHYVADKILNLPIIQVDGYRITLEVQRPLTHLVTHLKNCLSLPFIKVVPCHDFLTNMTLITGSGASFLPSLSSDGLLTGDVKYHDAVHARAIGKTLIDIGHFESEHYFSSALANQLNHLPVKITPLVSNAPWQLF